MRKISHPTLEEIRVEGILHALSDPVRVQIFMELAGAECPKNCSNFLTINKKPLPKSTLSQHFTILREAGLIHSERKGVELQNRTRCKELKEKFGEMISVIVKAYEGQEKKGRRKS